jgi:hypothetical protein
VVVGGLVLIVAAYLTALTPWFYTSRGVQDVGIMVNAAMRILAGQVPYRDFFVFLAPLGPWLTSRWFLLFGHGALSMIALTLGLGVAMALATYALARQLLPPATALVCGLAATALGITYWFTISHQWYATLFLLLSSAAGIRALRRLDRRWLALAGASSAVGSLAHQGRGPLVFAALAFAVFLFWPRPERWRALLVLCAGGTLAAALVLVPLAVTTDWASLAYGLVGFVLTEYPKNNRVPYLAFDLLPTGPALLSPLGMLQTLFAFVALAAGPLGFVLAGWQARRLPRHEGEWRARWTMVLVGAAAWAGMLYHPSAVHLGYVSAWFVVAWAVVLQPQADQWRRRVASARRAVLITAGLAGLTFLPVLEVAAIASGGIIWGTSPTGPVPLGTTAEASLTASYQEVENFLATHTQPGDPVVFYPYRSINYVLFDRPNPTLFDWMHTGENPERQVRAYVSEVLDGPAHYVIVEKSPAERLAEQEGRPDASALGAWALASFRQALPLDLETPYVEIRRGPDAQVPAGSAGYESPIGLGNGAS